MLNYLKSGHKNNDPTNKIFILKSFTACLIFHLVTNNENMLQWYIIYKIKTFARTCTHTLTHSLVLLFEMIE